MTSYDLAQERLDVAIATWKQHRNDHHTIPADECVFCEDRGPLHDTHVYDAKSHTYYPKTGD